MAISAPDNHGGCGIRAELTAGVKTFKKRAAEIADHAHNPTGAIGGGGGDFLKGLDENERHRESIAAPSATDLLNNLQSSEQHTRVRRRLNSSWWIVILAKNNIITTGRRTH